MRSLGESDPRHVGPIRLVAGLEGDETGAVFLGSAPDGRAVAVKVVRPHLADQGFRGRFASEVAALRQAAGESVIGAGPEEDPPWLAVAFEAGVSIRALAGRGVLLGEDALLRLSAGLVDAMTAMHRAGLVHRDLTPVSVRIAEDGVRVVDFGVARAVDHDVSLVVGTAEFMSPEQASGQRATAASDVFALGAVLHLAATGRGPFPGATRAEVLTQVVGAQPDLSPALPARVRALLAACLAKEPHRRPTLDQLRGMIGPVPPVAWPPVVLSLIAEERAELSRLLGSPAGPGQPTARVAPVLVPAAPPPPRRRRGGRQPERWKPDMWAVVSGGAIVVAVVFAIVMFNVLTPNRPLRASEQPTTAPATTTASAPTAGATTTTTTAPPEAPFGELTGLADKCVDVAGAASANGTPVQLHECNGTDAQLWEFGLDGTVRALGKCLDVTGGATGDGATVQLHDCNGTGAQQWVATTEGWIINVASNRCLDVPASNTADGTQLVIWTCHGEDNQVWFPPA